MSEFEIRLSKRTGETKTAQIFNQIAGAIQSGRLGAGDALVSERALAERLGVSRNIVRNAYRRLEQHGLVETVSTSGRRVARRKARRKPRR
ncbi:MAG TPA: winged helix-turn-helix domain-containing protein [Pyrinomonadaceae bacterium]|nr:winged helix-turn-helix domain-containing protein [Pyrinomonadaceae bacterium]